MKTATRADETIDLTLRILNDFLTDAPESDVGVRLWNGALWPDNKPHAATIVLKHPGALRAMLMPGDELNLGEAYIYDDFDIEGSVEAVFGLSDTLTEKQPGWVDKARAAYGLLRLPDTKNHRAARRAPAKLRGQPHSIERDREAVRYHYDVSNDFFALWLDREMVYSCAYFHAPDEELDIAQARKLDYICRKLRLRRGQRLLDLGSGWGALLIHAAEHYGVDATGITVSEPQAELANARIAAALMMSQCHALVRDYRQMDGTEIYDALVSVGMFEHVGASMLPTYFDRAYHLLKPGGVFLNHGIASRENDRGSHGPNFVDTYVFPDGELVPINETLRASESAGFEVRDVESLREHYALTLRQWVRRLEAHHDDALKFVDEPTYRVWRLYMSGSAHGFATGTLNVYQSLLVKPDANGKSHLPLTRADWY
jgi:cyclopropane-fatty-acyl-phospholipid synthase